MYGNKGVIIHHQKPICNDVLDVLSKGGNIDLDKTSQKPIPGPNETVQAGGFDYILYVAFTLLSQSPVGVPCRATRGLYLHTTLHEPLLDSLC